MEKKPRNPLVDVYDKTYRENKDAFMGGRPESFIQEAAQLIPKESLVLEYGAGQGRDALALAAQGFMVRAIDLSPVGVASMNEVARGRGLTTFAAEVGDARQDLVGSYDLITSIFMMHHLTRQEAFAFVAKIKTHTKPGGLNAIATFSVEGDFAKEDKEHFYPMPDELQKLYSDWEIVTYRQEENTARKKRSDGTCMTNVALKMVAKKLEVVL